MPVPYLWGCLVISALVSFVPLVGAFAITGDFSTSLSALLFAPVTWSSVLGWILGSFFGNAFLPLYMTRYMRVRVLRAERELTPILPTKGVFDDSFRGIARRWPPIVIGFAIVATFVVPNASAGEPIEGLAYLFLSDGAFVIGSIILGTFLWMYVGGLLGLYRIGKASLNLVPPGKDPNMGMTPIGSLALSLVFSLFFVVGLAALSSILAPFEISVAVLVVIVTVVAIVMFFLPLFGAHRRMAEMKASAISKLRDDSFQAFEASGASEPGTDPGSLARIEKLLAIQAWERSLANARTWPFDTSIIGKLLAILLSVTAIILSGYLKNLLPGLH